MYECTRHQRTFTVGPANSAADSDITSTETYYTCEYVWNPDEPQNEIDPCPFGTLCGGGDGGGDGGLGNNDPSNPCEKARELSEKMEEILNSTDIKSAITNISSLINQQTANGQVKENSFAIGIDGNGKYHVSTMATASNASPHKVSYNQFPANSGITQIGVFHNHTTDNSNSPGDLYELLSSNFNRPNYTTNFAQNNKGELFALNIYDRQKAIAFLAKYPKETFADGPNLKGELLQIYENFRSSADFEVNGNTNGYQVALVAFLDKLDVGVSLSKQTSSTSFNTFKTSYYNQQIPEGLQKAYTTTNCN